MAAVGVGGADGTGSVGEARVDLRRLLWVGPLTVVAAVAANVVAFLIAQGLGLVPASYIIPASGRPFTVEPVIMATIMGVVPGVILFALLAWFTRRPVRIFTIIAVIALVFSFATPFALPGLPLSLFWTLQFLHVLAAIVTILVLARFSRAA